MRNRGKNSRSIVVFVRAQLVPIDLLVINQEMCMTLSIVDVEFVGDGKKATGCLLHSRRAGSRTLSRTASRIYRKEVCYSSRDWEEETRTLLSFCCQNLDGHG